MTALRAARARVPRQPARPSHIPLPPLPPHTPPLPLPLALPLLLRAARRPASPAHSWRLSPSSQRRTELVLKYDPEQKGLLLGKNGSTINRVTQESGGALLELGKSGECTVRVSGPQHAVSKARSLLAELLHLDAASVKTLSVPGETFESVAGRGGEHLKRLMAEHGVHIDTLRGAEPVTLKLRGGVAGVKKAMDALAEMVELEQKVEEHVEVATQHVGMVLGKGATIDAIQRETGAVLDLQKKVDEGKSCRR